MPPPQEKDARTTGPVKSEKARKRGEEDARVGGPNESRRSRNREEENASIFLTPGPEPRRVKKSSRRSAAEAIENGEIGDEPKARKRKVCGAFLL